MKLSSYKFLSYRKLVLRQSYFIYLKSSFYSFFVIFLEGYSLLSRLYRLLLAQPPDPRYLAKDPRLVADSRGDTESRVRESHTHVVREIKTKI